MLSGTKVTLTCEYSAFPEANVKWIVLDVEGDPLPDVGYEVINGSLVLMALRPSDSAQYVCSVDNVAGTASASTILKVVGKFYFFLEVGISFLTSAINFLFMTFFPRCCRGVDCEHMQLFPFLCVKRFLKNCLNFIVITILIRSQLNELDNLLPCCRLTQILSHHQ